MTKKAIVFGTYKDGEIPDGTTQAVENLANYLFKCDF